jgi:hypothetical protein
MGKSPYLNHNPLWFRKKNREKISPVYRSVKANDLQHRLPENRRNQPAKPA